MKFFLSLAAIIAVASAATIGVSPVPAGPAVLVDENGHPISVGPAFVDGEADFAPIAIGPIVIDSGDIASGPAIIDFPLPDGGAVSSPVDEVHPIAVGPEIIGFPLPDGGAVTAPVGVSPVVVGPAAAAESSPLVQIIVNVQAPAGVAPGAVADPVQIIDTTPVAPGPVHVVDQAVNPVQVVDTPIVVGPVQVVDVAPIVPEPVQVVDVAPIVVTPVQVGTPILPSPAITLPEELN